LNSFVSMYSILVFANVAAESLLLEFCLIFSSSGIPFSFLMSGLIKRPQVKIRHKMT
jgi:hypothetical protein